MPLRHLFLSLVLLITCPGLCQRTAGGTRAPSGPRTTPDIGVRYGTVPTAPPPSSGYVPGRSADEEAKVEFTSESVMVEVPVVVTDKTGQHLHGLTKEKFRVLENGKEQKIAAFEELTAANAPLPPAVTKPGEFTNLTVDPNQPRMLAIIAIDAVNTPFLDQAYGRKELIKYLSEHLDPGALLGLVIIGGKGTRVLYGLTSDPAQLVAAVKKVNGEIPAMHEFDAETQVAAADQGGVATSFSSMNSMFPDSEVADQLRYFVLHQDATIARFEQDRAIETTMRSFLDIAHYVSGIPGRKALIWATGGFPFLMDSPSSTPGGALSSLYERTMAALNQAQVSIYPVDVRGLVSNSPVVDATFSGGHLGPQMMNAALGRSWLHASTVGTLQDFAAMTGGRAFYNTNDLAQSFHRAIDDASSYYLLGYYLDTHNNRPGWRKLKVNVDQPEAQVRARSGFLVTNATMNFGATRQLDEQLALNSPLDATELPVTVRWLNAAPDGDRRTVNFAIAVAKDGITIDETAKNRFSIDLAAVVRSSAGAEVARFDQPLQGNIKPESMSIVKAQGISYRTLMVLPPGRYTVKLMVRDNLSGRIGSVSAPLTVN